MAQLKDTVISGFLRVTSSILTNVLQAHAIKAHSANNSSSYSVGEIDQVLKTNGTFSYWGNELSSTFITENLQSSATADKNYEKGELFIWNGRLFKVVTPIAVNGSFSVGVNVQPTDLSTILKSLEQRISALE